MRYGKIFCICAVVMVLLTLLVPGAPALAAPVIAVTPVYGSAGTLVTVTGTVFDSYKGDDLTLFFDNAEISSIVPVTGTFAFSFNIPMEVEPGDYWVRVRSGLGSTLALAQFTVMGPEIKLDVGAGNVGITINVEGEGFHANSMVNLYYYNREMTEIGYEAVTSTGGFTCQVTIPESTAGKHSIIAEDTSGSSAEVDFEMVSMIVPGASSGAVGEVLTLRGNGFAYKSDITVYFDDKEVSYSRTDNSGNFEVSFNVPLLQTGTYDITARDEKNNSDKKNFNVTVGANLNLASGSIGTEIQVSGQGFNAGGTVTIKYDDKIVATTTADSAGYFAASFEVPVSASGEHITTVSDGTSNRQMAFVVESEAPPAPGLLLPLDSCEAFARTSFDWEDIQDDSLPVTYNLQVAADSSFSSMLLEKKRLANSEYTLGDDEELAAVDRETPYYWRVEALDGASNGGEWSVVESFYVTAPASPGLLLPETGIKADRPVFFDWEDVTSLNVPVTYILQVASDNSFKTDALVLDKHGLNKSEYTLTGKDKLPAVKEEAPYHWRVKAVDSAGNEGDWSGGTTFYVGFSMPGWIIYSIIGIIAIIVGFMAFLLGRRTAYHRNQYID